jgi:hypothetical protein
MQYQQQTAIDPQAWGRQYNPGNLQARYNSAGSYWWPLAVMGVLVFGLMPGLVTFLLVGGRMAGVVYIVLIVVLLLFALLIPVTYKKLRKGGPITFLYDHGFIDCFSRGEMEHVVRWEDIESFAHYYSAGDADSGGSHTYLIICSNMKQAIRLREEKQFIQSVQSAVIKHLYPSFRAKYLSDSITPFGRLGVSLQGLHDITKNTELAWNEVKSIKIDFFTGVRIEKIGERRDWASFDSTEIRNPAVLCWLIGTDVLHSFEFWCWL